jgi:hypothetical protein
MRMRPKLPHRAPAALHGMRLRPPLTMSGIVQEQKQLPPHRDLCQGLPLPLCLLPRLRLQWQVAPEPALEARA